jgi:uncharacterized protein YciI
MLYVIWPQDVPNSLEKRKQTRAAHLERAQQLIEQGRLVLGGPLPAIDSADPGEAGMTGSMIVAEFTSLAAAKAWSDDDPYVHAGVYESVTVKPFVQVLP